MPLDQEASLMESRDKGHLDSHSSVSWNKKARKESRLYDQRFLVTERFLVTVEEEKYDCLLLLFIGVATLLLLVILPPWREL
jgi:hypothetical protein